MVWCPLVPDDNDNDITLGHSPAWVQGKSPSQDLVQGFGVWQDPGQWGRWQQSTTAAHKLDNLVICWD